MKKLFLLSIALIVMQLTFGQLSGIKTIPGDFSSIEAAIAALNTQGVGAGGVTFNVAAGHTETFSITSAGLITTTTGSSANQIIFQKSGAGVNPLITAATPGTGTMDYIICFSGSDYITFDGIDVQENAANNTSTLQMEWAFAVLKASEVNGSQNITIKNSSISLNAANTASYAIYSNNITPASTTQLVVTDFTGTNSNNKFFGLSISNTYNGIYMYGRADATPFAFYDQNNEIGVGGANTITGLGGGTSLGYGLYCYYQNGIKIANNVFTGTSTSTTGGLYVMYLLTSSNANVDVYGNTISMNYNGTGAFYGIYGSGMGSSGTTNTVNFYNNSVINNNLPNHTSGTVYFIYISTGGVTANFYGNNVSGNTVGSATATSTGSVYYTYFASSPTTAGVTNMYNNTVSNNARIQSTPGSGTTYIFYNSGSGTEFNQYNNLINNITIASSGTTYCLYNLFSGVTKNVHHNTITNIYNANTTVYGIYNGNGTGSGYFYNNKIQNLNMNSASGTLYGIYQSSGVNQYHYNTFISELKAPNATGNPAIYGIYLSGSTTIGAFNNTIYLNAASTGSAFGATGIYASSTPNVELRNNVVVNNSVPGATGRVVAYQRSTATLTSYVATSNNNDFFAGTPGSSRLIYYDGTNSDQTLAAFKARVTPRDASSVTENPPFMNVSTSPYDLHIQPSVPNQLESGGSAVSTPVNILDDYDGHPRYPNAGYPDNAGSPASAPDIGADEFAGILLDITSPNITLTPFLNTSSTSDRILITQITDASGVPVAGSGLPVLYWKINSGSYNPVTAVYNGANTYQFSFGAGAAMGDVVSYYIVAQDLVSPVPNVGASPSAGAAGYTYGPPACSTPPTSPYTYTIVGTLSGVYPVGSGQVYPTLTAAIADVNFKDVVGPVVLELWDATYSASEAFPLIIYPYAGMSPSNTVTIRPKAGNTASVTGSSTSGILVLYGVDYVILDGSNSGGTDRNLTWENTSTAANSYAIGVFNYSGDPASNCTIKNCNVRASSQITNSTYAIILNAAGGGYDNIVIDNNNIFSARFGMQFAGVSGSPATNGRITNNIIGSSTDATAIQYRGIVLSFANNTIVSGNEIMGAPAGNSNTYQTGIYIMAGTSNTTIANNYIHDFYYTGTSGYGCYGIYYGSDATTPSMIYNNLITNIKSDGDPGSQNYAAAGIYVFSGGNLKIYHNTIWMTGATLSASYTTSYSACLSIYSGITLLDVRDNLFKNSMTTAAGTGGNIAYSVYCASANTAFTNINYNDYYSNGINPTIGYLGGAQVTLPAWQAATAQDVNSVTIDPLFVSATDLTPTDATLDNLGYYFADVPSDYYSIARTNPPDMGAVEFGTNPDVTTLSASGVTCEDAVVSGLINANGLIVNSFFDYGLSTAYGSSVAGVPALVTGTNPETVTATLSGLSGNQTYHFRLRGVTSGGVHVYGEDNYFMTNASGVPTVNTIPATGIGDTWATLNGDVNPNCETVSCYFEYGLTTSYGFNIATTPNNFDGGLVVPVDAYLGGLLPGETYHFRLVAINLYGTSYGNDQVFTTGANPPAVTTNPATNVGDFTARLNGTVNANNQNTTVTFELGTDLTYGTVFSGVPSMVTGNTPAAVYYDASGLSYNTTYHYRCVGQNMAGTTYGADQVFVTTCPDPAAAGAITGPASICQATSGHVYTVQPILYADGYTWSLPPGGTITAGANTNSITVSYDNSAVSGDVTVFGWNVCGSGPSSALAVTLNPLPVPVISGPDLACVTHSYTYITASGMTDYTWTVSAGGQIMSGSGTNSISVKWNGTGSQYVMVTYTSQFGCPAAAPTTLNVAVGNLTTPSITGSNLMCVNSGWYVYTTQQGYNSYVWTVSQGGAIVSGQGTYQIEVNWTSPGSKTVTVNYANEYGCSANSPASFAVTVLGMPGNAGPVNGTHELCAGTTYVSYNTPPIQNAENYIWMLPPGASIVEGNNTNHIKVDFATDAQSGNILVYGENLCGAGQSSQPFQLTVNPVPETPVATVDEFFVLHSSAPDGNQWYFNGELIAGAAGQDYQAEEEGIYFTIVTLNDCSSEPSNPVEVIFTGMNELYGSGFRIFPVPNDGKFNYVINIPGKDVFSVTLYNELGLVVYELKELYVDGKSQQFISLTTISSGVYTIVFKGKEQVVIKKVLVTK